MTDCIKSILKIPENLSLEDIHNLKKENKNFIEKESDIRTRFYNNLDINKDIVIIGNGPTLDERITRESIKKKFGNKISDDFYIVCCNETWVNCEDYDYIFAQDELIIFHYLYYNKGEKILITPSLIWRCAGSISIPKENSYINLKNCVIPYCLYKNNTKKNLLCLWQVDKNYYNNSGWKMRNIYLNQKHENLKNINIGADNGGSMAIKLFSELGFKNFFFIGFGGSGHSSLISKIPKPYIPRTTINVKINEKDIFVKKYPQFANNKIRNADKKYENIYDNLKIKYNLKFNMY